MKKRGIFLSVIIMLGVTSTVFAQRIDRYPRMEMRIEGAAAQQLRVERKVADAQAAQAKKEADKKAISKEIKQASDELLDLWLYHDRHSISYGSNEYKYLDAMWETLGARNETACSFEKYYLSAYTLILARWETIPLKTKEVKQEINKAEQDLRLAEKRLNDAKAATAKNYNAKKAKLEQLKKQYPALAKKYAELERRLHL